MFFRCTDKEVGYIVEVDSEDAIEIVGNIFKGKAEPIEITDEMKKNGYTVRKLTRAAEPIDAMEYEEDFPYEKDMLVRNSDKVLRSKKEVEPRQFLFEVDGKHFSLEVKTLPEDDTENWEEVPPNPIPKWADKNIRLDEKMYKVPPK